jgi:hypothetical protein
MFGGEQNLLNVGRPGAESNKTLATAAITEASNLSNP